MSINLIMFFLEIYSGIISHSTALLSDSLDMLGDTFVYALTLYTIGKSTSWIARTSLVKSAIMFIFGLSVLAKIVFQLLNPVVPIYETIGIVGFIALAANTGCFLLLNSYKTQGINMQSTWLCSRNDIIANVGVLIAAFFVSVTHTIWPDIIVGLIITVLFVSSAYDVLKLSLNEIKHKKKLTA